MPVERDRVDHALLELLMDLERTAVLRGESWTFRQVARQFEWELFALHQRRQQRNVRSYVWSYGQLRRTRARQNLPEDIRREAAANRTSVAICIEPTIAPGLIICNHFFEARPRSQVSLIRPFSPFSRRHACSRRYRGWNADWGVAWRRATSRTNDSRAHVRQRLSSQRVFLSRARLRHTGLAWDIVMCTISYDSRSRLVFVEDVWVSYVHFVIQLVPIRFPYEMEGVFFQQDDARLPAALCQLLWPVSSRRLSPIETHAGVWNWIELRIFCVSSSATILGQSQNFPDDAH